MEDVKSECDRFYVRVLSLVNPPHIDAEFETFFKNFVRSNYDLAYMDGLKDLEEFEHSDPCFWESITDYYIDKCLELNRHIETNEEVYQSIGYDPSTFFNEVIERYSLEDLKEWCRSNN